VLSDVHFPCRCGPLMSSPATRDGLILLALLIVYYVLNNTAFFFAEDLFIWRDLAANAIQIEHARHFQQYLGPYSRVGATHPGPITFYYLAFAEPLLRFVPALLARYSLAQLLLNAALIAYLTGQIRHLVPGRWAPCLFVSCAVIAVFAVPINYHSIPLCSIWGPSLVVVPMLVFTFGLSQLALRHWEYSPITSISAVLATHNHFGTLAVILPTTALVATFILSGQFAGNTGTKSRRPLVLALAILMVAWAPPLIEQFQPGGGNLGKLLAAGADGSGVHHSLLDALKAAGKGLSSPAIIPFMPSPLGAPLLLPVLLAIAGLAVGSRAFWKVSALRARSWLLVSWLLFFFYFVAGILQPGNIHWYAFDGVFGLAGALYFMAFHGLSTRWREQCRLTKNRAPADLIFCLLVIIGILVAVSRNPVNLQEYQYEGHYEIIERRFLQGRTQKVALHFQRKSSDDRLMRELFGLSHALVRMGYDVRITEGLKQRFGNLMASADGTETFLLLTWHEPCVDLDDLEIGGFRIIELPVPSTDFVAPNSTSAAPLDTRLDITDPRLHFDSWSRPESKKIWSRGQQSKLRVFASVDEPPPIRLLAEASILESQLTVVYLNGRPLGSLRFEGEGPRTRHVPIPSDLWRPGSWNEFVFQTPLACDTPEDAPTRGEDVIPVDRGIQLGAITLLGRRDGS
jgi:hypothetical protein